MSVRLESRHFYFLVFLHFVSSFSLRLFSLIFFVFCAAPRSGISTCQSEGNVAKKGQRSGKEEKRINEIAVEIYISLAQHFYAGQRSVGGGQKK